MRILGNRCRVRNVKAINWGTKSLKQGCFVISIIQANANPNDGNGNPILTETQHNGIEDCIAIEPSKNNARETTVLHIGGVKSSSNHAQGFGRAGFIRKNFVDCQFLTSIDNLHPVSAPFPSAFITSKQGTGISGGTGTFVGKRPHFRIDADLQTFLRFENPKNAASRWNGYFPITVIPASDAFFVSLASSLGTNDDSSFVIMGTEFRGIAVSSCLNAVVEQNQIHNCWIGGPYQSLLDDSVSEPTVPPTLVREERLDPLNASNVRSLVVRENFYRDVAVGPYWNMGGVSGAVSNVVSYNSGNGLATVNTTEAHKLWVGARIKIESAPDSRYEGVREITEVHEVGVAYYFSFQLAAGLVGMPTGSASYRVVSGTDFLVIEHNHIHLADLTETEFAIKEYPFAASPSACSPAEQHRPGHHGQFAGAAVGQSMPDTHPIGCEQPCQAGDSAGDFRA